MVVILFTLLCYINFVVLELGINFVVLELGIYPTATLAMHHMHRSIQDQIQINSAHTLLAKSWPYIQQKELLVTLSTLFG